MKKQAYNSHLSLEARLYIENCLNENISVTTIAKQLSRDRSNISREILKHRQTVFPSYYNGQNPCILHNNCTIKGYECFKYCKKIEVKLCDNLTRSPHVCNGCIQKKGCRHIKYYYKANEANNEYKHNLINSRDNLHYAEEELNILNNDFYGLVINTKSIYHSLLVINSRGFKFNIKSIYRQIKEGKLKLKSHDLPRTRKRIKKNNTIDKSYKKDLTGMTYEDYIKHKKIHIFACEIQMDTVEGAKINNAPVMLTLEIVEISFLFIFKISSQTSEMVLKKLEEFKNTITQEVFDKLFEILLTDNGKEFSDIDGIKNLSNSLYLFYCHPYSSCEKGSIENNHELIRRIIPQGVGLNVYSQNDYNLICSHINSLYRESLKGKCPFDLIQKYVSIDTLKKLGIKKINPKNVMLIPELLGEKNINNIKKYLDENDIKKANISFKK